MIFHRKNITTVKIAAFFAAIFFPLVLQAQAEVRQDSALNEIELFYTVSFKPENGLPAAQYLPDTMVIRYQHPHIRIYYRTPDSIAFTQPEWAINLSTARQSIIDHTSKTIFTLKEVPDTLTCTWKRGKQVEEIGNYMAEDWSLGCKEKPLYTTTYWLSTNMNFYEPTPDSSGVFFEVNGWQMTTGVPIRMIRKGPYGKQVITLARIQSYTMEGDDVLLPDYPEKEFDPRELRLDFLETTQTKKSSD